MIRVPGHIVIATDLGVAQTAASIVHTTATHESPVAASGRSNTDQSLLFPETKVHTSFVPFSTMLRLKADMGSEDVLVSRIHIKGVGEFGPVDILMESETSQTTVGCRDRAQVTMTIGNRKTLNECSGSISITNGVEEWEMIIMNHRFNLRLSFCNNRDDPTIQYDLRIYMYDHLPIGRSYDCIMQTRRRKIELQWDLQSLAGT